jgi:exonuclease V
MGINLVDKHRPWGVKATDLSAQLWCEKQLEFSLTKPRIRTAEMRKGEDIHSDKEKELYDIVEVSPKTKEDRILLKLHNTITAIEGLEKTGIAREIPLLGRLNSLKVTGIADEARLEDGKLTILDTKTRKSPTLPRAAQSRSTRFQMMVYKELFDEISHGQYKPDDVLGHYCLTSESSASQDFIKQHKDLGQELEPNVLKAAKKAFSLFKELPIVESLQVRYEHQETKNIIGTDDFKFDYTLFWGDCAFCEEFWLGKRAAKPVAGHNAWKCSYCQYKNECDAFKSFMADPAINPVYSQDAPLANNHKDNPNITQD